MDKEALEFLKSILCEKKTYYKCFNDVEYVESIFLKALSEANSQNLKCMIISEMSEFFNNKGLYEKVMMLIPFLKDLEKADTSERVRFRWQTILACGPVAAIMGVVPDVTYVKKYGQAVINSVSGVGATADFKKKLVSDVSLILRVCENPKLVSNEDLLKLDLGGLIKV